MPCGTSICHERYTCRAFDVIYRHCASAEAGGGGCGAQKAAADDAGDTGLLGLPIVCCCTQASILVGATIMWPPALMMTRLPHLLYIRTNLPPLVTRSCVLEYGQPMGIQTSISNVDIMTMSKLASCAMQTKYMCCPTRRHTCVAALRAPRRSMF